MSDSMYWSNRAEAAEAALAEALEAIRFTQEYAQLPAVDGWSWWDFYRKHRPEDAQRLKAEWDRFDAARGA